MTLHQQAENFANDLTATVQGAVGPHCPAFRADVMNEARQVIVWQGNDQGIPLTVDGEERVVLRAEYRCELDHGAKFLRVSWSRIAVLYRGGAPILRYEFERPRNPNIPSSHLHIHHEGLCEDCSNSNISSLYALSGSTTKRGKSAIARLNIGKYRNQHDFHLPLGGERFRPCLEDFLHALIHEFGMDHQPGWEDALADGREQWRLRQTAAVVRDAPKVAVSALEELGYRVYLPESGEKALNRTRLRAF